MHSPSVNVAAVAMVSEFGLPPNLSPVSNKRLLQPSGFERRVAHQVALKTPV